MAGLNLGKIKDNVNRPRAGHASSLPIVVESTDLGKVVLQSRGFINNFPRFCRISELAALSSFFFLLDKNSMIKFLFYFGELNAMKSSNRTKNIYK